MWGLGVLQGSSSVLTFNVNTSVWQEGGRGLALVGVRSSLQPSDYYSLYFDDCQSFVTFLLSSVSSLPHLHRAFLSVLQPATVKTHNIIERTANFVCQQGAQFEIVLKAKQAGNSQFDFLRFDHYLNPYYKHILRAMKEGRYTLASDGPHPPPQGQFMSEPGFCPPVSRSQAFSSGCHWHLLFLL